MQAAPTDIELCQRYRAGDNRSGELLLERHNGLIYDLARRLSPRYDDQEDFAEIGKIAMLRAAAKYDGRSKFSTYAVAAIRNAYYRELDHYRRWSRDRHEMSEEPSYEPVETCSEIPFHLLDPLESIVIRRRYGIDGHPSTFDQIALSLGQTPYYVSRIHESAMAKMRELVARPV